MSPYSSLKGNMKVHKDNTYDRRRKQMDDLKAIPPAYNGWWIYEFFKNSLYSKGIKEYINSKGKG